MKKDLKDKVIQEYRKSLGNVTIACRRSGIVRKTFYEWCKEDLEFDAKIKDIRENELVDFVENALMQRIQLGDTTAIIFALKTLGKSRGYVERQEQVVSGNPFEIALRNLPDIK